MKQSEVVEAIRQGRAEFHWVALAEGVEVMARPAQVGELLNLDHWDYSQVLRLVRRRPGVSLPSYESPLSVLGLWETADNAHGTVPAAPEPTASSGTLGERCLAWCLREAEEHRQPDASRVAYYHGVAVRGGKPLGIKTGNHCASAQSRAMLECLLPGDVRPHEPRASAKEMRADAVKTGRWRAVAEVRGGKWLPRPGDLAIYDRSIAGRPETSWYGHVDRVIRVSEDGAQYENVGANEVAGAWRIESTPFNSTRLMGFVEYPGEPLSGAEREEIGGAISGLGAGEAG
jgi:hypothetical protein